jgi:hypothetical protein
MSKSKDVLARIDWVKVAGITMEIVTALIPTIRDFVTRSVTGEKLSDHWLRKAIPREHRTVILDKIKTEARRAKGLPT